MDVTERHRSDGSLVIAITGELDLATAPGLRTLLLPAIEADRARPITLDLAGCTFIDSTGLAVLVEAGRRLDDTVSRLRVTNLRDQPRRLFELTGVERWPFIRVVHDDASEAGIVAA